MKENTMTLERKFAAWLKGKDDRDMGREDDPPLWVRERADYLLFYRAGYDGDNYYA